jgi:hypothetical protein
VVFWVVTLVKVPPSTMMFCERGKNAPLYLNLML